MTDPIQRLEAVLAPVGETAAFLAEGVIPPTLPGLDVEGAGSVGLPIAEEAARRLIAVADQAPYGLGTETIVDTEVRRVWQVEPSRITLRNPVWDAQVRYAVAAIKKEFGLTEPVRHELYKLLVYETGSFFAPHRDTEKTPGMFATLVICLPSRHEGGTLVVEHEGREERIDFGGPESEFETPYAAFYADCRHEIEPVTSGYRVCLIYNLAVERAGVQPSAPRSSPAVTEAAALLRELFAEDDVPRSKVIFPLEHQYTESGLDPAALKGADRLRAEVLAQAAEFAGYDCFLALITHHQTGSVDYGSWTPPFLRSRRSRRGYYRDYREEEPDPEDEAAAEFEDIYDSSLTLDHWIDLAGEPRPFGKLSVDYDELLCGEDREDWAVSQTIHEATGNEGATLDRWYRHAALVLWPRDRFVHVLAAEGQAHALPELERRAARAIGPDAVSECRVFASAILDAWKKGSGAGETGAWSSRMLAVLERIGTVELARRFVSDVLPADFNGSEGEALCGLCERFGWETLQPALAVWLERQQPLTAWEVAPTQQLRLLASLYVAPATWSSERRGVCVALARSLAGVVERWKQQPVDRSGFGLGSGSGYGFGAWQFAPPPPGRVEQAVRIFALGEAPEALDRFLDRALRGELGCGLHGILIPDVKAIARWLPEAPSARPAYTRLREHCLEQLRAATAEPVQLPTDWRREAALSCKCEDCAALARFLADPTSPVGRFPLAERRRGHLHSMIDRHQCDCTHETERIGRPYSLVCRKTTASYERREKQYQVDLRLLRELEQLPPG